MDALDLMLDRASVPALLHEDTEITDAELAQLFQAAMTAPDHGQLRPWRFIVIRGAARAKLGDVFAEALLRRTPGAEAGLVEKDRQKPQRSPLLIGIVARITPDHPKAPDIEQVLAAGMAGYNIILAAQAAGLGAVWLTGAPAYDSHVQQALGIGRDEKLLGFVYVGRPKRDFRPPRRADWQPFVSEWTG
ncbi:MAG: nitroreductase [Pseudomonadota bacterium]|nr:nitroreductase [Pseudomonadota bacterium]